MALTDEATLYESIGGKQTIRVTNATEDILTDGTTTTDVFYVGFAPPGSTADQAVWKIFIADSRPATGVAIRHADGSQLYNKVWDDRVGYTYP